VKGILIFQDLCRLAAYRTQAVEIVTEPRAMYAEIPGSLVTGPEVKAFP
jgi:hypothetical protein